MKHLKEDATNPSHKPQYGGVVYMLIAVLFIAIIALSYKVIIAEDEVPLSPVLVIDFMAIAEKYPENASDEEIERQIRLVHNAIQKLADAGYVVLDAANVVKAPDSAYLNDLYELAMENE